MRILNRSCMKLSIPTHPIVSPHTHTALSEVFRAQGPLRELSANKVEW